MSWNPINILSNLYYNGFNSKGEICPWSEEGWQAQVAALKAPEAVKLALAEGVTTALKPAFLTACQTGNTPLAQAIVTAFDRAGEGLETLLRPAKGQSPLQAACETDNLPLATAIIGWLGGQAAEGINGVNRGNRHPLFAAIEHRNPALFELLIKNGAIYLRENGRCIENSDGKSVVTLAIATKNPRFIAPLDCPDNEALTTLSTNEKKIYWRVQLSKERPDGQTLLHSLIASPVGEAEDISKIVRLGANLNQVNREGQTPLYLACMLNKTDRVAQLIELGVKIDPKTQEEFPDALFAGIAKAKDGTLSFLEKEARRGNAKLLHTYLLTVGSLDLIESKGTIKWGCRSTFRKVATAFGPELLCKAIERNDLALVTKLLSAGARKFALSGEEGSTPLDLATASGDARVIRKIANCLSAKERAALTPKQKEAVAIAEIDTVDAKGLTPLQKACRDGDLKMVKSLLTRGALVDSPNSKKLSPLLQAICYAKNNRALIVEVLIDNGANVNCADPKGSRALHHACQQGDWKAVRHLALSRGIEIDAPNRKGNSVLEVALKKKDQELAYLFIEQGADWVTLLEKRPELAPFLPNPLPGSQSPLAVVISAGKESLILALAPYCNLSEVDEAGNTPLHLYVMKEPVAPNEDVLDLLVGEAGELAYVKNHFGETPLDWLATPELRAIAKEKAKEQIRVNPSFNEAKLVAQRANLDAGALRTALRGANLEVHGAALSPQELRKTLERKDLPKLQELVERFGAEQVKTSCIDALAEGAKGETKRISPEKLVELIRFLQIPSLFPGDSEIDSSVCQKVLDSDLIDYVGILLENGATLGDEGLNCYLGLLAITGQHEWIETAIEAGAKPNQIYEESYPLVHAVSRAQMFSDSERSKSLDTIRALLYSGARVDFVEADAWRLLLEALVLDGDVDAVREFLALGIIGVNDQELDGQNSLLHHACRFESVEMIELLLSLEAEKNLPNARGETPLDLITDDNDLAEWLALSGFESPRRIAVQAVREAELHREALDNHASQELAQKANQGGFEWAVATRKWDTIQSFAGRGLNTEIAVLPGGCTPLHLAVQFQSRIGQTQLLDLGANPNSLNAKGETPLDLIRRARGVESMIEGLRARGLRYSDELRRT